MRTADSLQTSPTLIRSLAAPGNEEAWTVFVGRYSPLILQHCRASGLRDFDAEEVRSRVLLKLVRALAGLRYDPARTFRGYLRTVVNSALIGYWRERNRPGSTGSGCPDVSRKIDSVEMPDSLDELGVALEEDVTARLRLIEQAVERVRSTVKTDTWRAYWLTAIEDRTAPEAALELDKSVGAIYMAKHRVAALLIAEGKALAGRETANHGERP